MALAHAHKDGCGSSDDGDGIAVLLAAARGELTAREQVFAQILPEVERACRARMGQFANPALSVDDVVQEVALALLPALARFRPEQATWSAFVLGVVRNKVADAFRDHYRRRASSVWIDELPERAAAEPGPDDLVIQAELAGRMRTLLRLLPERQQRILELRVLEGRSGSEVADMLGISHGAVRVAQHRALRVLREAMAGPPA